MAPPRQPPDLVADIVGEILLLLPPADPASLVRASLVCKPWRRLLSDQAFHRRYRAFHGAPPPMLGFLYDHYTWGALSVPRFVPTVAPCPVPQPALGYRDWSVIDCRHGRVLFDVSGYSVVKLVLWDPVSGRRYEVPEPPIPRYYSLYGAAVLCAVRGCDHLDCHVGPFLVVLMTLNSTGTVMQAQVYSSEAGAWNLSAHRDLRYHVMRKPSTLIGDDIYFGLNSDSASTALLRYDLGKNRLSTINVPAAHEYEGGFATMAMEDGSLGFAGIRATWLQVWSRNADTEVADDWGLWRIIDLAALIPNSCSQACIVGSAEGAGVLVVSSDVGLFTIELMSGRMRKVSEPGQYDAIFPFMSFYIGLG